MTLTVSNSIDEINEKLNNKYADDAHCLELLLFFSKHTRTRFSRLALVHALNNGKLCVIDRALKRLVNDGLLILHSDKIVELYSLAGKEK